LACSLGFTRSVAFAIFGDSPTCLSDTLAGVPTARPRHLITETDDLTEALEAAARRWPEDRGSRTRLLVHLVKEGHRALQNDAAGLHAARVDAVRVTSGALTGAFEPDYLASLREDWPE
jgi:hypothetical protein